MKTTRFFAAALALLSVLSCQKEEQPLIGNPENEDGALITCTFAGNDAATKTTTTDGKTPVWTVNDKIMLYDGVSNTQELTLAASGTASSTQGVIDGTDATKFTFVKPSGWTNVYAIYPYSACVGGFSAGAPKINFAGQDGTFGKANICAAAESAGTMSFKNVGAILKFTSKSVKAAKVVVPAAGLSNNFTVSFSGDAPSLVSESASNSNEFSIGDGSGAIYIGVPAGEIAASSVFTYKTSADATLGTYTTGAANTVEANKIYNLGAMMGVLPGLFTVDGSGNKVQFSKGNLQATYSTSTSSYSWGFAGNQYDYVGNAAGNTTIDSQTNGAVVDLFGWSTSSTSYGISTSTSSYSVYSGVFVDWGNNAISNGGNTAGLWKTLTKDEWDHLLNTRSVNGGTGKGKSYQETTLTLSGNTTTIDGLIIAPDNYTGSLSATTSWSGWQTMESAGCVFLPAAGARTGSSVNTGCGCYWSSTPEGENNASQLYFFSGSFYPADSYYRYSGSSVRLVCVAQ